MLMDQSRRSVDSQAFSVVRDGQHKTQAWQFDTPALNPERVVVATDDAIAEGPFRSQHMRLIGDSHNPIDAKGACDRLHAD